MGDRTDVDVELRRADVADRIRDERISFDVTDEPVRLLLKRIRFEKELDVTFASGTRAEIFDARVSLTVADDTIENALRAISDACGGSLAWTTRRDVVVVYERDAE